MVSDAYRIVLPVFTLAALCAFLSLYLLAVLILGLGVYVCYFFRNPRRVVPAGENLIVSPADGRVVRIFDLPDNEEPAGGCGISIFLNIFDVHVNRSPVRGKLENLVYKRGRFKVAFDEEASRVNEQNILTIRMPDRFIVVKQVAGLIARRVICWKREGDEVDRGELIGLIRFGSRVDVLLPRQVRLLVQPGDRVKGGSSILGEWT
jgi:phosphatidylserine decarboxylase